MLVDRRIHHQRKTVRTGAAIVALGLLAISVSRRAAADDALVQEPAPEEKPVPEDKPVPEEKPDDDPALARMRTFVSDLQKDRNRTSEQGLGLAATLVPDLFVFEVGRRYLKARDEGLDEVDAEDRVVSELKGRKSLAKRSGLRLKLSNPGYKMPDGAARVFTLQEKFPGQALRLTGLSKRSTEKKRLGRRLPASLLENPANLRRTKVRIKKFWKLRKRGSPPKGGPDPDPQSRFKDPILSDPIPVRLIEEKPVELILVVSKSSAEKYERYELRVGQFKKYEGPFRMDHIDLNAGRRWKAIRPILLRIDLPPEGHEVPEELEFLSRRILRKL